MKIVLDARYLDGTFSGIGTYSRQLIEHLSIVDTENDYTVLVAPSFKGMKVGANFKLLTYSARPVSVRTLATLGRKIDALGADLMHSFFPLAPLMMRTPLVVTVHDLQPFLDPDFSAGRPLVVQLAYNRFYRFAYPATMRRATWVLADSYYTRDSIAELFPEQVEKLVVLHPGLDPTTADAPLVDEHSVRAEYRLPNPYFLYYGSTRPNKNLPRLVQGFARYLKANPESDIDLVLVLKADRFFRDVRRQIRVEGVSARVRVLEQVSPDAHRAILRAARAFAFPTKYEGFGFPPLEAMACGVPVVAGRSGSLPEVCADAAELVDPDDANSIAGALSRLTNDEHRREELIAAGLARVKKFNWLESAKFLKNIYTLLCSRNTAPSAIAALSAAK